MARANATMQRLYIDADLTADAALPLDLKQTHYLRNVLRLEAGASLLCSMAAMVNGAPRLNS